MYENRGSEKQLPTERLAAGDAGLYNMTAKVNTLNKSPTVIRRDQNQLRFDEHKLTVYIYIFFCVYT